MDIEFRSYKFDEIETREVDDHTGHVSAHFSIFGNQDTYGTIMDKGAFKKTIKDNKGKFAITWFHQPDIPVGIGVFEEDDKGLHADTEVDLDIQAGHDVYSGIKRGYIDCCSIGFKRITETLKDKIPHLKEVKLYEGAFITRGFAANELAKVESVRAATAGLRRVSQAIQEGVTEELQVALDDVRKLLSEMGDGLLLPKRSNDGLRYEDILTLLRELKEQTALRNSGGPLISTRTGEESHLGDFGPQMHPDPLEGFRQIGAEIQKSLKRT